MLNISNKTPIWLCTQPTDMRKGFDGLSGIVRGQFAADPTDGSLFLFVNRRRDRMKILHFDGGGFWLYYRLLEAGTFEELTSPDDACRLQIDATQLAMWLSRVSLVASDKRRAAASIAIIARGLAPTWSQLASSVSNRSGSRVAMTRSEPRP
jgi:transposase